MLTLLQQHQKDMKCTTSIGLLNFLSIFMTISLAAGQGRAGAPPPFLHAPPSFNLIAFGDTSLTASSTGSLGTTQTRQSVKSYSPPSKSKSYNYDPSPTSSSSYNYKRPRPSSYKQPSYRRKSTWSSCQRTRYTDRYGRYRQYCCRWRKDRYGRYRKYCAYSAY